MVLRGCCLERDIDFINLCLKQGVATRSYVFINLQKSQQKPNFDKFANAQCIEITNSLLLVHSSQKEGMMLG